MPNVLSPGQVNCCHDPIEAGIDVGSLGGAPSGGTLESGSLTVQYVTGTSGTLCARMTESGTKWMLDDSYCEPWQTILLSMYPGDPGVKPYGGRIYFDGGDKYVELIAGTTAGAIDCGGATYGSTLAGTGISGGGPFRWNQLQASQPSGPPPSAAIALYLTLTPTWAVVYATEITVPSDVHCLPLVYLLAFPINSSGVGFGLGTAGVDTKVLEFYTEDEHCKCLEREFDEKHFAYYFSNDDHPYYAPATITVQVPAFTAVGGCTANDPTALEGSYVLLRRGLDLYSLFATVIAAESGRDCGSSSDTNPHTVKLEITLEHQGSGALLLTIERLNWHWNYDGCTQGAFTTVFEWSGQLTPGNDPNGFSIALDPVTTTGPWVLSDVTLVN